MITVMGATRHTERKITETLLEADEEVRALGRSESKLATLKSAGAEALNGDVTDARFLAEAFRGADSVYTLLANVTVRDATHVLVGLLYHESDLRIEKPTPIHQDSPITFLRSVIYSDSGLHRGYVILRTNDFTCPESRVSSPHFSFDRETIFPVIFTTIISGRDFPARLAMRRVHPSATDVLKQ